MKEYSGVSKWYIILCVLFVITGVVMLIWPHLTLDLLGLVLGVGMLVVGIAHILIYFTKDNLGSVLQPDLTVGVILAAFGAFMLMHMDFVPMILPFGAGILLLIGGITKVQYAIDMKRLYFSKWMTLLVFAGILTLLGVLLLYNPFKDNVLIYFIGSCLILDGLLSIVSVLMITHRKKQFDRGKVPSRVLARINGPVKSEVVEEPEESTALRPAKKHHLFGKKSHEDEADEVVTSESDVQSASSAGVNQSRAFHAFETGNAANSGHASETGNAANSGHAFEAENAANSTHSSVVTDAAAGGANSFNTNNSSQEIVPNPFDVE